ncbi:M48 family metalloprotease [Flavobacterium covae]
MINNTMKLFLLTSVLLIFISCKESKETKENENETNQNINGSISVPDKNNVEGEINNLKIGCGFNYNLNKTELKIYYPREREIKVIENIISYSGLPLNFEIYSGDIQNAVATMIDNKRYIIYDPKLLSFTDEYSDSYWSSISILAHEIGHHLSGHTLNNNISNHDIELQADKFSGFVLYKMGATQEQATNAMNLLGSEVDSESHPNKRRRIQAILDGWNEASKQRYQGAIPPPPNDKPEDFYEFTTPMLITKEKLDFAKENYPDWYTNNNEYLFGVVTEVDLKEGFFNIRILKSTKEFQEGFRKIENEDWKVWIDTYHFGEDNEMCHACQFNFESLIVPGRRLKFSMVESCPDCGTSMNGVWFLTYAKAMDNSSF